MKTLYDLFSHVLDVEDASADETSRRRALRAASWGVSQVQTRHLWNEYHTNESHQSFAPVTADATIDAAGTLTVDPDGDVEVPAWADRGSVRIGTELFVIAKRIDDTAVSLDGYGGAVVDSLTKVQFVNDRIPLTYSVRQIFAVRDTRHDSSLSFVNPPQFRTHQIVQNGVVSQPSLVTSVRTNFGSRRTELRISPAPAIDTTFDISYHRNPSRANLVHDCGAITVAGQTVTIATALGSSADVQHAILLVSANANAPDADQSHGHEDPNPIEFTFDVLSRPTATTLTVTGDPTDAEGKGAILTDTLDIPEYAYLAAEMYAEAAYQRFGNGDIGNYMATLRLADAQMRIAMEQEGTLARNQSHPVTRRSVVSVAESLTTEA